MVLVADSGSTKTTWCIIKRDLKIFETCQTSGINPFLQSPGDISGTLRTEFSLSRGPFDAIYFYGAGCANPEKNEKVSKPLRELFATDNIFVFSDLMAAARSLCGDNPGIAAILGTGSNSCYYDGKDICKHVPPLGYILGDEGSGTVLGRKLLSDILKNQLPDKLCRAFFNKYKISPEEILDRIYRQPFPNRFMAQFTHFIAVHIENKSLYKLVKESFSEFLNRNVRQFPEAAHLPLNFTGSIGWYFRNVLEDAVVSSGFTTGVITREPMEGLLEYHKKNYHAI